MPVCFPVYLFRIGSRKKLAIVQWYVGFVDIRHGYHRRNSSIEFVLLHLQVFFFFFFPFSFLMEHLLLKLRTR